MNIQNSRPTSLDYEETLMVDSFLGHLLIRASELGITVVRFAQRGESENVASINSKSAMLNHCAAQLREYFSGKRTAFNVPLDLRQGTDFQQRVWKSVEHIPFGATTTYGELAESLGDSSLARAVGAANGANPVAILIPCHRVIGADGSLTGYAWGIERKKALLKLEGASNQYELFS